MKIRLRYSSEEAAQEEGEDRVGSGWAADLAVRIMCVERDTISMAWVQRCIVWCFAE